MALLRGLFGDADGIADLGPRRAVPLGLADVMVDELVTEIGQRLRPQPRLADARKLVGIRQFLVEMGDQIRKVDVEVDSCVNREVDAPSSSTSN
ncbi:hypothetical protein ACU686_27310 [Yinghuangia aomiensis]